MDGWTGVMGVVWRETFEGVIDQERERLARIIWVSGLVLAWFYWNMIDFMQPNILWSGC